MEWSTLHLFYTDWSMLHLLCTPYFSQWFKHAACALQWNEAHSIFSTVIEACCICSAVEWSTLHLLYSDWSMLHLFYSDWNMLHLLCNGMKHVVSILQWLKHVASALQWNEACCISSTVIETCWICFAMEWNMLHLDTHTQYVNGRC